MARSPSSFSFRALLAAAALVVGSFSAGCTSQVAGGGDGGGGSGGGSLVCEQGAADCNGKTCDSANSVRDCVIATSQSAGVQSCDADAKNVLHWGECAVSASAASTPLVLSFDGGPVAFAASDRLFDLTGTMSVTTDWPSAATPWLAIDRNGNGAIDGGEELFGSATVLSSGARAENGFAALRELDSDGDGRITPADKAWASLLVWSDRDGDRSSSAGEVSSASAARLLSIDLDYAASLRCDLRRNCEVERASFRWADAAGVEHTGAVIDVHLKFQ